jgi:phage-related protein
MSRLELPASVLGQLERAKTVEALLRHVTLWRACVWTGPLQCHDATAEHNLCVLCRARRFLETPP